MLNIQHIRDNEIIPQPWNTQMLWFCQDIAALEQTGNKNNWKETTFPHVVQNSYTEIIYFSDPSEDYTFTLLPGDVIKVWYSANL